MKIYWFTAFFCALSLVGCISVPSTPVTPTLPILTASVTATPPQTLGTPTSTPTPIPDFSATEHWITSTAIVEAVQTAQQSRVYGSYPSPDGMWLAEVIIYDCIKVDPRPEADANAYEQLRLVEKSSGDIKVADSQLQSCGGLGAFGLEGLFWSNNSRYFYYTNAREGVPDGCSFWQKPISRFDTNTLSTEELGAGFVSSDQTRIAAWQENELVLWDVNEGDEAGRISPLILNTETGTGPIAWSPDSQSLVYVQPESFCPVSGNSHVVHVDVSTLDQNVLLESDAPTFGSVRWDQTTELILFDENGKEWIYTFDSKALEPLP